MNIYQTSIKKKIRCINDGVVYDTIRQAALNYRVSASGIGEQMRGKAKSEISFEQAREMLVMGGRIYTNKKIKSDVIRALQVHFSDGFRLVSSKVLMTGEKGDYIYQNGDNSLGVMFQWIFDSQYGINE